MKIILATLFLALVGSGCSVYETNAGQYVGEYDTRECRASVKRLPDYPTAAQAATPGGMDRAAVKIQELEDQCMGRLGYKRARFP